MRYVNTRGNPAAAGFDPRSLGIDSALVAQFSALQFPFFNIGGGYSPIGTTPAFQREARDSWSYQLNATLTEGRHVVHSGAEFRLYNDNTRTPGRASGQFNFSKSFTQANPSRADSVSGDELASFLLGYPSGGRADLNIDPAFQSFYYALFVQDDIRVTPRLTLNVGLRWDYERPYVERYNRMFRGFAFDVASPLARSVPQLNLTGGLMYAGSEGQSRMAFRPDRNNIQPRIGAAYKLSANWVLRGGYGLFYLGVSGSQPTTGFSQASNITPSLDGGNTPRVTLANGWPEGLIQPARDTVGAATNLG